MAVVVACIGAANEDRKAALAASYQPATSNPVHVHLGLGGVARNIAEALARLGCAVEMFTVVGNDHPGDAVVAGLDGVGVGTANVLRTSSAATGSYTAVLEPAGGLVCGLADMAIYDTMDTAWLAAALPALAACQVWCVDANIPAPTLAALAAAAPAGTVVVADPVSAAKAPRLLPLLPRAQAIFPDVAEAAALTGSPVTTPGQAAAAATALCEHGVTEVVVSLGAGGVVVAGPSGVITYPAFPVADVAEVTGAGDAFVAGYVYGLQHAGASSVASAVACGLAAASLAVQATTSVPETMTATTLHQQISDHWREPSSTS